MRYIIVLSYNGSAFSGWQIQKNAVSVQGTLQDALGMLLGVPVAVTGAGRTDAGVNAANYVAHFDCPDPIPDCGRLVYRLNAVLPKQIAVHSVKAVADSFHARFSAVLRQYRYYIHNTKDPFLDAFSWYYRYELDVERMNRACVYLAGVHDCTCFEKKGSDNATSICDIKYARWEVCGAEVNSCLWESGPGINGCRGEAAVPGISCGTEGRRLIFTVEADRFLRNMVRAIVGTMVDIGRGVHEPEYICEILDHGTRGDAGQSVPGHALFLTKVGYGPDLQAPCPDENCNIII